MLDNSLAYWLTDTSPSGRSWRSILLFGSNTATYKFALGSALLDVSSSGDDDLRLADLAIPFAEQMCRHIQLEDRQATNPNSAFLNACRDFNSGRMGQDQLVGITLNQGFRYVLDAFHRVKGSDVPRFFSIEGSGDARRVHLASEFLSMGSGLTDLLGKELEARWRLVESAWATGVSTALLDVTYDRKTDYLHVTKSGSSVRKNVGHAKWALSGYQGGQCFYCQTPLDSDALGSRDSSKTYVDHVIPYHLNKYLRVLDHVWNLVNSCFECNMSKGAKLPARRVIERVYQRNEYYINSNHPLKEAIINMTGTTAKKRVGFFNRVYGEGTELLPHSWDKT
jgi:5-methylcytosine-specific restriction endonuclease McrA